MGFLTSAMMNIHGHDRRRPRLSVRERRPYVRMFVLLTAVRVSESCDCRLSALVGGITLTSEPVSMRKCALEFVSLTKNRRLVVWPGTPVAESDRPTRFPMCRERGNVGQHLQIGYDTSRVLLVEGLSLVE